MATVRRNYHMLGGLLAGLLLVYGLAMLIGVLAAQTGPTLSLNLPEGAAIKGRVLLEARVDGLTTFATCEVRINNSVTTPMVTHGPSATPADPASFIILRSMVETMGYSEDMPLTVTFTVTPAGGTPITLTRVYTVDNVPAPTLPPPVVTRTVVRHNVSGNGYALLLAPPLPTDQIELEGMSLTASVGGTVRLITGQGPFCRDGRRNLTFAYPVGPVLTHYFLRHTLAPGDSLCLYQTSVLAPNTVLGDGVVTLTRHP